MTFLNTLLSLDSSAGAVPFLSTLTPGNGDLIVGISGIRATVTPASADISPGKETGLFGHRQLNLITKHENHIRHAGPIFLACLDAQ